MHGIARCRTDLHLGHGRRRPPSGALFHQRSCHSATSVTAPLERSRPPFGFFLLPVPSTTDCLNHRRRPGLPNSEMAVFAAVKPIQPCEAASPCWPTVEVLTLTYSPAQRLGEGGARGGNRDRFHPRWVQGGARYEMRIDSAPSGQSLRRQPFFISRGLFSRTETR